MKIKYIKAKNFLSIGKTPVEIDFTKHGNIIHVMGRNLDRGEHASNGSGKSSILEIIVYGLYGKLIKKMSHKEAINNKTKKGLEVEIHWDDYRIVRKRKPDELRFWKGDEELTLGGIPATQDEIVKKIGLSYQAFINTAFFGQHNQYAFLSCDSQTKREIVENLLALDCYNDYAAAVKKKRKDIETEISTAIKEYELIRAGIDTDKRRIEQINAQITTWRNARQAEVVRITSEIETLRKTATAARPERGEIEKQIKEVDENVKKFQEAKARYEAGIEDVSGKVMEWAEKKHATSLHLQTVRNEMLLAEGLIRKLAEENKKFSNLEPGVKCPVCLGGVDPANFVGVMEYNNKVIANTEARIIELKGQEKQLKESEEATASAVTKGRETLATANGKLQQVVARLNSLELQKRGLTASLNAGDTNVESLITAAELQLEQKKKEATADVTPYDDILVSTKSDLAVKEANGAEKKTIIKTMEEQLPYFDYLIKAFGDNGIRKFVIDDMIPALNARVNYWLQFLIDNKLSLKFNNQLEEEIESNPPDGDPFVYNGLSGGEHNRIDLAISQAFSYLMMLSSGTCPSIVALDEVVSYQDRQGVECVFNMIVELARDRQVLVVTHDSDLQQMLAGADKIIIEKKDGYSRIAPE